MRVPATSARKVFASHVPLSAFAALFFIASTALSQDRPAPARMARMQRPADCVSGYVGREAFPGDYVCVTPETRQQTAEDNGRAASRVRPGGGAYGADTCIAGYVWREASRSDHVCVTPEARRQAGEDNAQANSRRRISLRRLDSTLGQLPESSAPPPPDHAGHAPCDESATHTLTEDGVVETEVHRPDGVTERRTGAGTTLIYPDGRTEFRPRRIMEIQGQPPNPPMLATDPGLLQRWREYHAQSLLEIFSRLAENDPGAFDKLMRSEAGMTLYEKINHRTGIIQDFLSR